MEQNLNTLDIYGSAIRFDPAFRELKKLTWLPWVGEEFVRRMVSERLLVVGESHYFKGSTPEERETNRQSYISDAGTTRKIVSEALVRREWTTKTLRTIPMLLFSTTEIDHSRFWIDSAYYNFVQRPLDRSRNERPNYDDYVTGWTVFADVVGILHPSHCLFIGVTAANSFNAWIAGQNTYAGTVHSTPAISGTCPRIAKGGVKIFL